MKRDDLCSQPRSRNRKATAAAVALVVTAGVLAAACLDRPVDPLANRPVDPVPGVDVMTKREQLIGRWLVVSYKGVDGEIQNNSSVIGWSYTFSDKTVVHHWPDGLEQTGTYEWYFESPGGEIDTIVVHYDPAKSDDGRTEASGIDVHYAISFPDLDLHLRVQETGEEMMLRRIQ